MDLELTDEQRMLAESVRAFVSRELLPHEVDVEKLGEVPPDLGRQITQKALEVGLYAANLPESVGGLARVDRPLPNDPTSGPQPSQEELRLIDEPRSGFPSARVYRIGR